MKIGKLNNLPIHFTTSSRINEACKLSLGSDVYISNLCSSIEQGNNDLSKGLGKSLNRDFTPLLLFQDRVRDNAFIGFRDYASSFSHSADEAKATAAKILPEFLKPPATASIHWGIWWKQPN